MGYRIHAGLDFQRRERREFMLQQRPARFMKRCMLTLFLLLCLGALLLRPRAWWYDQLSVLGAVLLLGLSIFALRPLAAFLSGMERWTLWGAFERDMPAGKKLLGLFGAGAAGWRLLGFLGICHPNGTVGTGLRRAIYGAVSPSLWLRLFSGGVFAGIGDGRIDGAVGQCASHHMQRQFSLFSLPQRLAACGGGISAVDHLPFPVVV